MVGSEISLHGVWDLVNPKETTRAWAAVATADKEPKSVPAATDNKTPPVANTDNESKPIADEETEPVPVATADETVPTALADGAPTPDSTQAAETPLLAADNATNPLNFDDELFAPSSPDRPYLTRAQKRRNRQVYSSPNPNPAPPPEIQALDISPEDLRKLQREDGTLTHAREVADGKPSTVAGWGFFRRDGLLYRTYQPPGSIDSTEQLVQPVQCRIAVLKLARDIPLAGHLGRRKTTSRILQRFYWPGMFRDVSDYCRLCPECQKSSPRGRSKAPLIPLPIIDVPFKRMAMDIVGPLPRSSSGNCFILVLCDYATRYPEAIPLRTVEADCIAKELVKVFARVGVPDEILTD